MNEIDYIKATNRVKVSAALTILRDVLPSKDDTWGITGAALSDITHLLREAEEKLFSLVEIKDSSKEDNHDLP